MILQLVPLIILIIITCTIRKMSHYYLLETSLQDLNLRMNDHSLYHVSQRAELDSVLRAVKYENSLIINNSTSRRLFRL